MKIPGLVTLALLSTVMAPLAFAAEEPKPTTNKETSLPPAASILGISPSQIHKPSDPSGFVASVVTAAKGNGNDLPAEFAVEFSPMLLWNALSPNKGDDYRYRQEGDILNQAWTESFSLSLATHKNKEVKDGTDLGVGARLLLVTGLGAGKDKSPYGASLELAAATRWKGVSNNWDSVEHGMTSEWMTYQYKREEGEGVSFRGCAAALQFKVSQDDLMDKKETESIQYGISLSKQGFGKTNFAVEYNRKEASESGIDDEDSFTATLEHRLKNNDYTLLASFGKTFSNYDGDQDMVAIGGLKIGLGEGPTGK